MNLYVNDTSLFFSGDSLADLLIQLEKPLQGIAVAINQDIVPKSLWAVTRLEEGVQVFIFESIAGG